MRRRWILVGAAALVVVGVGTGGGVWAARYQPLEPSSLFVSPGGRSVPLDAMGRDEPGRATLVDYHDGTEANVGVTVLNNGHFTVRVTGVEVPAAFETMLRLVGVRTDVPGQGLRFEDSGTVPFQPFDLHPGDDRLLFLDFRMGDCEWFSPGATSVLSDVAVHFSFLGIDHRAVMPFAEEVDVTAPPAGGCPRPSRLPTH